MIYMTYKPHLIIWSEAINMMNLNQFPSDLWNPEPWSN